MNKISVRTGLIACFLLALIFLTVVGSTHAQAETSNAAEDQADVFVEPENYRLSAVDGVEDGDTAENNLFEFESFIKSTDITDGTEPFDKDNAAGNDSGDKNGIVRTFDTVTYPIKITINPKKVDKLSNIVLKITGTVENGISGNQVNAKFAVGGYEDISKNEVGFEQLYTIEQTGNSVMVPISLEVKGAKNGVKLTPKLKVEVVSVDGVDITKDKVTTAFDNLPSVTTSGKVNIKPYIQTGLAGQGIPYVPFSGISGNPDDTANLHSFSVSFGLQNLDGKTDNRGATFPTGEIKYHVDLSGYVLWDGGPNKGKTEAFAFTKKDKPLYLYDERAINSTNPVTGSKNTLSEGESYSFSRSYAYSAPLSKLANLTPKNIESQGFRSVWDSGDWSVNKPSVTENKVTYTGSNKEYIIGSTFPEHRADGWTGGKLYGQNDKIFSSNAFMIKMENQYRIGGENNPDGYANNAYYTADVVVDSYVDESGKTISVNKTGRAQVSERNNPEGSYSVQNTFFGHPTTSQLGTPNIGWGVVSKGDASTILGSDVHYGSSLGSSVVSFGGFDAAYRWNTDAFELTKEYAAIAKTRIMNVGYSDTSLKTVANNTTNQKVFFGIAKFTDNKFESFTQKGINDYTWFESYDEAIKKGPIGAMKSEVHAATGPIWTGQIMIPLHVKTKKIGSYTDKGSANIVVTNYYPYSDKERTKQIDVSKNATYKNPSLWNEAGEMTSKQAPAGSTINFETLAILNAEVSSTVTTDKATYYNSEEVDWTVKNSIVLPVGGAPDGYDGSVQLEQTLPKGLDYKVGSGLAGSVKKEPKITKNADGTTNLVWDLLISGKTNTLDTVTFSTTINPFALTKGVQSSLTLKNVISTPVDTRKVHLRTATKTINILKVGMVGIYEDIDIDNGEKNSTFNIKMQPYTTIEDEWDVKGITVIPLSGDKLGSLYQGSATLDKITVDSPKPVSIYLNNAIVTTTDPHKVDVTKNGWYKYTGGTQNISKALTVLFHVDGTLSNTDNVQIGFSVKTKDNNFGNMYLNETVINSATDYKLSPTSNRVRYTIRADAELNLERIRIYTANAKEHLPIQLRINKEVLRDRALTEPLKLVVYEKGTTTRVYEKSFTIGNLQRENDLLIPSKFLKKDTNKAYEVRVEGYNTDKIYVDDTANKIDTQGYTSSEKVIEKTVTEDSSLDYKGVIMTEREIGKDMVSYYETLTMPLKKREDLYTGYGYELNQKLTFTNDLGGATATPTHMAVEIDNKAIDGTTVGIADDQSHIELLTEESVQGNSLVQTYYYPNSYMSQKTGEIVSEEAAETSTDPDDLVYAGNKLYVPVWMDAIGAYDHTFKSVSPLGVNEISISVTDPLHVEAYMFGHLDSETMKDDALLITPSTRSSATNELFDNR